MFCSKCGNMLSEGAIFCSKCGERVCSVESTPSESPDSEEVVVAEEINDRENVSEDAVQSKMPTSEDDAGNEEIVFSEDVNKSSSVLFCKKCGAGLEDGVKVCYNCGTAVDVGNTISDGEQECPKEKAENFSTEPKPTKASKLLESFVEWHVRCWKKNKIFTSILIIAELIPILWLIFKTWEVLLGILIIASIVLPFIRKKDFSDKDRRNSIEVVIGFAKMAVCVIIACIIVFNWNSISSIWRPGAVVRDAYFLNYSDEITIGEALENVYTDCKWSTYSYKDNEYVRFKGNFVNDNGEIDHHQIDFLIIGDSATIDSWWIDGIDESWAITPMLVAIYERNGVSW